MPQLVSKLKPRSAAFAANAARMAERLAEVRSLEQKVRDESSSKREKFEARGQLLPRERVAQLIDRGSDFLELSTLASIASITACEEMAIWRCSLVFLGRARSLSSPN